MGTNCDKIFRYIRESQTHTKESDYDENKRELLGLGVKVSFDGSFVLYDTRTDGVKCLP